MFRQVTKKFINVIQKHSIIYYHISDDIVLAQFYSPETDYFCFSKSKMIPSNKKIAEKS